MTSERKSNGFYTLENTISEAKKVMEEHNLDTLPSQGKLFELGYGGLGNALSKYHGGINNFIEKHFGGERSLRKPPGYWQSLENTISESEDFMEEHNYDTLPTQIKLHELGYGGLCSAIRKYHGGLNNFKEKHLGERLSRKPNEYWTLENTLFEAKKVMKEQGVDRLPSGNKLEELGYSRLIKAITSYHGGFPKFREKHLGEKLSRKPNGYWTLEKTIYEAKKVMKEQGVDTLPTENKLKELNYSGLSSAIINYHGGLPNFREIMNQELGIKSNKEHLTEVWKEYTGK
jgi:hypothetical protein